VLSPVQACHAQSALHVWVPPSPQAWLASGSHSPSSVQASQSDQTPLLQVRDCVPQLPHARLGEPSHAWFRHSPHVQRPPHVSVPPSPQPSVLSGSHSPSSRHAEKLDQTPLSQTRDCVPQLPQERVDAPSQTWPSHSVHEQSPPQTRVPS
jgi:hypothetical protein